MKKWICCLGLVFLAGAAVAKPAAVLELNANISNWLGYYSDTAGTNETYDALATLGISNMAFSVQVEEGAIAAFAKVETSLPDAKAIWLSNTNLLQMKAVSENEFTWVPEAKKNAAPQLLPVDSIRIRFSGSTVLIADEKHFPSAEALVSTMGDDGLLQGWIRLAPLLDPLFSAAEKVVEEQEDGFGKSMMDGMLKSARTASASIQDMPAVSVAVEAVDRETRKMTLALEYQTVDAADSTKNFFNDAAEAWKNPNISKQQLGLAGLVDTPHFREVTLNGPQLQFVYEWPASDDAVLFKIVAQATVGNLFSFGGSASSFPVHPEEAMDAPRLGDMDEFDAIQFGKDIRSALFFNNAWSHSVDFVVDCFDFQNVDLLNATLTNVCVLTTNGVDVAKQKRPGSFRYDTVRKSASISLHREKDGAPAQTASFTLQLTVPTSIQKYTLTKQNPLLETDEGGCCLIAMSNSVISLRSKGLSLREAKIYVLNKDGKYLGRKSASWSDSRYRAEYKGTPDTVELVWPVKTEFVSLDFKGLAVGQADKLKMPTNPTNSVVTRYTLEPLEIYSDPDMEAITASTMTYVTNTGWKKNEYELQFPKPANVEIEGMSFKSYLAGVDEFVGPGQRSGFSSSGGMLGWDLTQTNILDSATAVFGELEGRFWSGVGDHTVNVSEEFAPLIREKALPSVSVEHNVVWVQKEQEGLVLDIQAFDESGRRLKKDHRQNYKNSARGYFFWGTPVRVTVTYAAEKESVVMPFEIELKEGGLDGIPAVRKKLTAFDEVLGLAKEVDTKASSRYGNLLSGQYYICNSNKEPRASIPLEIAHSDPTGVAVFGYDLKPVKGYYFRKVLTEQEVKSKSNVSNYAWSEGSFEATNDSGVLLATPVERPNPSILIRWRNVYVNFNDCSKLEVISFDRKELAAAGWIQVQ